MVGVSFSGNSRRGGVDEGLVEHLSDFILCHRHRIRSLHA